MIILVSPQAHYPAHNWPNTVALMRALRQNGCNVRAVIFSTTTEPVPADLLASVEPVFSRLAPGWRQVAAGKWQERRFGALMNFCETAACLFKALRVARYFSRSRGNEAHFKFGIRNSEFGIKTSAPTIPQVSSGPVLHFIGGSYWMVVLATLWFKRVRFVYSLYDCMLSGQATGLKARLRPHLKKLLRRATATGRLDFTCENEFVHEEIAPLLGSHIHVVPYAIDDSEALPSRQEARQRLGLPATEKIILFFGTHRREKDYHTPLKGCLSLPNPPLALFVGKVISSNDPQRVIAECGYPNARVVNGFVPEEMAKYYFAAADAVVLPYEANFSRGSGVLIECCRYLRPMIASATPYFSAFLTRYPCGVSYVPGDSASFADAAARLFADRAGCQAALAQARHDHSWKVTAEQYIKLYVL
ncbi:MAG TPA: glycosyltransferase [Candidatus Acidoferrales bacterium]|nr:glycosyltransferase [Candidatus Acidoferrales bacterium]